MMIWIISLAIAALLGLIPANIAKRKGRRFGLWWLYGWLIFIVALIHSLVIPDANAQPAGSFGNTAAVNGTGESAADELKKMKGLLDDGIISQEEYDNVKKRLLKL